MLCVSGVQQSDSVIHIRVYALCESLFPFMLLCNTEQRPQGEVGNEARSQVGSMGDGGPTSKESSYCQKWSDSCEVADFTVHSPAPTLPLSASPKFSRPHLSFFFLGSNVPSLALNLIFPLRLNFNNSIVPLRKKSTWCRW